MFEFNSKDNKSGELVRAKLHSVALTNTPFIDELGELIANKNNIHQNKGEKMDENQRARISDYSFKNENSSLALQNEALKNKTKKALKT